MWKGRKRLPSIELKRVGWEALVQRLGLADATRFLREYASSYGDYVQWREKLFEGKTVDDLGDEMEKKLLYVKAGRYRSHHSCVPRLAKVSGQS